MATASGKQLHSRYCCTSQPCCLTSSAESETGAYHIRNADEVGHLLQGGLLAAQAEQALSRELSFILCLACVYMQPYKQLTGAKQTGPHHVRDADEVEHLLQGSLLALQAEQALVQEAQSLQLTFDRVPVAAAGSLTSS